MAYVDIVWPVSLPQKPQKSSYEEAINMGQLIASTDFDAGPTRQRRRTTAMPTQRTCLFVLTKAEKETLYQFIDENIGRSFWFPDPTGDGYLYVRISSDTQLSFKPWGDSLRWQIVLKLDVWPYVFRSDMLFEYRLYCNDNSQEVQCFYYEGEEGDESDVENYAFYY